MRTHVAHWGDLIPKLPFGSDSESKMKRRELFDACDPRGIGILSQAEVVRYYFRLLPTIGGLTDMKEVLNACFRSTRETVAPVTHIGSQQFDRNQFRVYMMHIWYYIKLWDMFVHLDETDQKFVHYTEFLKALPFMAEWGFGEVDHWRDDPEAAFQQLDQSGSGEVPFGEFADFCLRHGVPKLSEHDDAAERKATIDALTRTHPQLASKAPPDMGKLKFSGSVPPVPPPGQKLPCSQPSSLASSPTGAADARQHRWSTQYMIDFPPPSRRSSQVPSAAVSTVATPSRTRPSTPSGRVGSKEPFTPSRTGSKELWRQNSAPSIASNSSGELDRIQLRSKLEANLPMYNTGQMRRNHHGGQRLLLHRFCTVPVPVGERLGVALGVVGRRL